MTPFERFLLDVLADRAMTGFEIARAVDALRPGSLRGREGVLYPALMSLERQELVVAEWDVRDEGRRRVYRPAPTEVEARAEEQAALESESTAPDESSFPEEETLDGDA